MAFDPERITFFAKTDARGANVPFGIKAKDRSRHVYVIGKTGMGKSTLLENMAVQDIKNGEGFAFIDPHGATAETLLDYIPEERKKDVLYFAPFDTEHPVAFNVMEDVGPERRHLVVSGLMSVFKKIWVDAWSARMEYILQNTLLALLEYPDSTLLGVNRMLSDKHYRKKVIDNISDPAVKSFWVDEFLNYNERYMQEAGDAIKNKIGQFTANPLIRNIIGQPKSSFDIRKMMDEQKIIIMNLSKGLVGESNANLLGSMLTTRIYLAAMSRADMSAAEMKVAPNFYFYVDEFQSFANATFADILSEARKYKLNLTIAHQYIEQMEEEVRNAVFGNVGTIISFRVGPFDAEVLETIFAPQFYAVDICNLGFAQIYLTLMIDGIGSQPFSAVTLPPISTPDLSCKEIVVHASREQFAHERGPVEAAILAWHEEEHAGISGEGKKNGGSDNGKGRSGGSDNRRGKPRSDNGGTRNDGGGRSADTPKRSEKQNDRGLDDLRSVLAQISKDTGGDDTNKRDPKRRDEREPQDRKQGSGRDEKKNETLNKQSDPSDALKATLAEVLGSQSKSNEKSEAVEKDNAEEKRNEPEKPKSTDNTSAIQSRRPDEKRRDPRQDGRREKAARTDDRKQEQQQQPQQADADRSQPEEGQREQQRASEAVREEKAPEPKSKPQAPQQSTQEYREQKSRDPLDPKLLERMMRSKSTDKSPLK